jgi:hypothetical protein
MPQTRSRSSAARTVHRIGSNGWARPRPPSWLRVSWRAAQQDTQPVFQDPLHLGPRPPRTPTVRSVLLHRLSLAPGGVSTGPVVHRRGQASCARLKDRGPRDTAPQQVLGTREPLQPPRQQPSCRSWRYRGTKGVPGTSWQASSPRRGPNGATRACHGPAQQIERSRFSAVTAPGGARWPTPPRRRP